MLKTLAQSRADNSFDRELRRFLNPDLLVVDDFGLRKLSSHASSDFYELIIERHMRSSTIVTSNRLCGAPHKAEKSFRSLSTQRPTGTNVDEALERRC